MDVVKFIEERNRMCKSFNAGCKGCPASNACEDKLCCAVGQESTLDATAQIVMVEEWAAAHPHKTRQSIFLEQWPEARIRDDGVLQILPCSISASHRDARGNCVNMRRDCYDCRKEFWGQEVE